MATQRTCVGVGRAGAVVGVTLTTGLGVGVSVGLGVGLGVAVAVGVSVGVSVATSTAAACVVGGLAARLLIEQMHNARTARIMPQPIPNCTFFGLDLSQRVMPWLYLC